MCILCDIIFNLIIQNMYIDKEERILILYFSVYSTFKKEDEEEKLVAIHKSKL